VVGLDNAGKTTIIERLKVRTLSLSEDALSQLQIPKYLPSPFLWIQPQEKQTMEVAATVGFHIDQFKKGYVQQ
jgi:GTPase SAR1 family protein